MKNDDGQDCDHCASRAADLDFGSAEYGNRRAPDDGGIQTAIRRNTARNGECHGQRERNDPDDQSRHDVLAESRRVVPFHASCEFHVQFRTYSLFSPTSMMLFPSGGGIQPSNTRATGTTNRS